MDAELDNLLAKDDELNFTDESTLEKPEVHKPKNPADQQTVSVNIPPFPIEHMPSMQQDDDSISTFHPGNLGQIIEETDLDEDDHSPITHVSPVSILRTSKHTELDAVSRMLMSGSASRISSLESELFAMDKAFKGAIEQLKSQAAAQATAQSEQGNMLSEILMMLKLQSRSANTQVNSILNAPEVANHPQVNNAGHSSRVTGQG
jgi:hypothetical protein